MGCSESKLDQEEAVRICKDRKRFIKQALEQRTEFASCHIAYIQSLKHVSDALRDYIQVDDPLGSSLDSFMTISPSRIMPRKLIQDEPGSAMKVNCLVASGSRVVTVEEMPPVLPETTFRVEAYSPSHHYGGVDRFFQYPSSSSWNPMTNSPEPLPHSSKWDFFWNPFSSLDYYGYPYGQSDQIDRVDYDIKGVSQVRDEEGIPEIEKDDHNMKAKEERDKTDRGCCTEEVTVEDIEEEKEGEGEEYADGGCETTNDNDKCTGTREQRSVEVSSMETTGQVAGIGSREVKKVGDGDDPNSETPGYTVYVNRRPMRIAEVIEDLEDQFSTVCNAAEDVSSLLEASRAQYSSSSPSTGELTAMKMLNPVALFRSGCSSKFLISSSAALTESGDLSDETCTVSGSHQSTLDRLFAWEKKLYDEVRSGARARIAYEKKCTLLRNQDVKRKDDPSSVDKTRAAIQDLRIQIKVSIHSIEAISERIEALRDKELLPQLLDLVHGLTQMWKVMAECHQIQKRTLDEAKLLLACTPSKLNKKRHCSLPDTNSNRLARLALNLEARLRNWRDCFETWVTSQRSYVLALAGWLLRCFRCDPDPEKPEWVHSMFST
ncbi:PREDICTED: uncharacterized protein LOC104819969 isoform X2 [Tarenaya hassleriana]|uniref:uncharacterized protein LOC104819969 isoform X2 n=1 Tax=Tarenaya hassleriana TaxID=28532 RepID=UPI00053CA5DE|nr:PREDICTED: uncharacterized protein LOC104819969 isoform X2 [Tarenaya hassleriana]